MHNSQLVYEIGVAGASQPVAECWWFQHAGSAIQGCTTMESHVPVIRSAYDAAESYPQTGSTCFISCNNNIDKKQSNGTKCHHCYSVI